MYLVHVFPTLSVVTLSVFAARLFTSMSAFVTHSLAVCSSFHFASFGLASAPFLLFCSLNSALHYLSLLNVSITSLPPRCCASGSSCLTVIADNPPKMKPFHFEHSMSFPPAPLRHLVCNVSFAHMIQILQLTGIQGNSALSEFYY